MKRFLSLIFFMSPLALHAQMNIGQQNIQPVKPQWEQYEFQKYGKIGATLYTGTVNYSIPVYTYKDKDFEFPIALSYSTNGFRPNHKSGILGHGWTLMAGGMVTRAATLQKALPPTARLLHICGATAANILSPTS